MSAGKTVTFEGEKEYYYDEHLLLMKKWEHEIALIICAYIWYDIIEYTQ